MMITANILKGATKIMTIGIMSTFGSLFHNRPKKLDIYHNNDKNHIYYGVLCLDNSEQGS